MLFGLLIIKDIDEKKIIITKNYPFFLVFNLILILKNN